MHALNQGQYAIHLPMKMRKQTNKKGFQGQFQENENGYPYLDDVIPFRGSYLVQYLQFMRKFQGPC